MGFGENAAGLLVIRQGNRFPDIGFDAQQACGFDHRSDIIENGGGDQIGPDGGQRHGDQTTA